MRIGLDQFFKAFFGVGWGRVGIKESSIGRNPKLLIQVILKINQQGYHLYHKQVETHDGKRHHLSLVPDRFHQGSGLATPMLLSLLLLLILLPAAKVDC